MRDTKTRPGKARPPGSKDASATTAPTQFIKTTLETYACRRFGGGAAPPLVCLQPFTGTLDNWDPAVAEVLARGRELILFESAGLGCSTGEVPTTIPQMPAHFLAWIRSWLRRISLPPHLLASIRLCLHEARGT